MDIALEGVGCIYLLMPTTSWFHKTEVYGSYLGILTSCDVIFAPKKQTVPNVCYPVLLVAELHCVITTKVIGLLNYPTYLAQSSVAKLGIYGKLQGRS